jgi:hypothetical protein
MLQSCLNIQTINFFPRPQNLPAGMTSTVRKYTSRNCLTERFDEEKLAVLLEVSRPAVPLLATASFAGGYVTIS